MNVTTISSLRNKRKLIEPKKFEEADARPLKKRRRYETETSICDEETRSACSPRSPFRPWSDITPSEIKKINRLNTLKREELRIASQKTAEEDCRQPVIVNAEPEEAQNLSLDIKRDEEARSRLQDDVPKSAIKFRSSVYHRREQRRQLEPVPYRPLGYEVTTNHWVQQEEPLSLVLKGQCPPRVPSHPALGSNNNNNNYDRAASFSLSSPPLSSSSSCSVAIPLTNHLRASSASPVSSTSSKSTSSSKSSQPSGQQRNYKNMTRERRIEANARERTRVHTISAAFDTLRRAIPAYSHNQKLSKLSVLRIACSYIMTLGKIVEKSEEEYDEGDSLESCVDMVNKTIEAEEKLRKKKED